MQRLCRLCLFPSFRCVLPASPISKVKPPVECLLFSFEALHHQSFFCSQSSSDPNQLPKRTTSRQRSRHAVAIFLERTEDTCKVLDLLNEKPWDEDTTPDALKGLNAKLTVFIVSEVVKICVDLDTALNFFKWWEAVDGNEPDSYVYGAVMYRLGKAGRLEEMEAVANECESNGMATVGTFTIQISSYKRVGCFGGAIRTWRRMEKFGIMPNLVSYTTMIDVFATMKMYDEAGDLYLLFLWERFFPNVKTLSILIYHLAEAGKLDAALVIFKDMLSVKVKPNALTYTALMGGYAKVGNMDAVVNLVKQFKDVGNRPHRDSFQSFFLYLLDQQRVKDAERVMLELWPDSSHEDRKRMIFEYQAKLGRGGCGRDGDANLMTEDTDADEDEDNERSMTNPTSVWNYIGLIRCLTPWRPGTAAALEHANVKWDGHLVAEIMKRIKRVDVGWKFFVWVEGQRGFSHDKFTYSRMIQLLLTDANFVYVKQLLVEAQSKHLDLSLHTYNDILKFCGLKCTADVALDVFDLLEKAGLRPDRVSYQNLIHALHKCGRCWRAATVSARMQKAGFPLDAIVYSFVVCGFAEAGHMKYAKAFYKRMRACGFEPYEKIYKAFINGFYQTGRLNKAEQVFWQMKRDGIAPSGQVYDLMIKVFRKNNKSKELFEIEGERKTMSSTKAAEKRQTFEKYLNFHQIFMKSFAEGNDVQSVAAG